MSTIEDSIAEIYAPPKAKLENRNDYRVEGEFIVGRSPITLPDRCVRSNGERDGGRLSRTFTDTNTWTIRFSRKKCQVTYSLSKEWRRRLQLQIWTATVCIFLGIGLVFLGSRFGWFVPLIGLVFAAAAAILRERSCLPLYVAKEKQGEFYLRGCGREFLDSVAAERSLK